LSNRPSPSSALRDATKHKFLCIERRLFTSIPFIGSSAACGFPSPADDYLDRPLDLNELLIQNHAATFAVRVAGEPNVAIAWSGGNICYSQLFGLRVEALRALDTSAQWRTGEASVALPRGIDPLFQPRESPSSAQRVPFHWAASSRRTMCGPDRGTKHPRPTAVQERGLA
jgi:hypothetical protein